MQLVQLVRTLRRKKTGVLLLAVLLTGLWAFPAHARAPLPDAMSSSFVQETREAINDRRARHGVPPVAIDPELMQYARERVRSVSTRPALSRGHRGLEDAGENLYWRAVPERGVLASGEEAVASWYEGVSGYDFDHPGFSGATAHFTQLVWRETTHVGIARVSGWNGERQETYIAVTFRPSGNRHGRFAENVPPPAG